MSGFGVSYGEYYGDDVLVPTRPVMPPVKVFRVGGVAGTFNVNHGLNGIPSAAIPIVQTPGILRLDVLLYDDLKVYLHASDNSVYGLLALWPPV